MGFWACETECCRGGKAVKAWLPCSLEAEKLVAGTTGVGATNKLSNTEDRYIFICIYIYIRMFPCRASDASPTIASSIMRCHHCGGRFPAPNHMWEWAWNAHDSVWELCVFHQLCLLRWWNRLAAVGGAWGGGCLQHREGGREVEIFKVRFVSSWLSGHPSPPHHIPGFSLVWKPWKKRKSDACATHLAAPHLK